MVQLQKQIGVVVIGRNEGDRLKRCIYSLLDQNVNSIIYVDSGSTDGSVAFALSQGVIVEELDNSIPFTMARGRNIGFSKLITLTPDIPFVQFVDGDCEVDLNWIENGISFMTSHPQVVSVCGFISERQPHTSIYNQLISFEWQGPTGRVLACGGNAIYRTHEFKNTGGFNSTMIAGEEPELCVRLRQAGGMIWRLDLPMVLHDADMHHFTQWWKRAVRCGHAYAEGFAMHGAPPEYHKRKALFSSLLYGLALPIMPIMLAITGILTTSSSLIFLSATCGIVMLLAFARAGYSTYRYGRSLKNSRYESVLYAAFTMLAKFPESQGVLLYVKNRMFGHASILIEYESDTPNTNR